MAEFKQNEQPQTEQQAQDDASNGESQEDSQQGKVASLTPPGMALWGPSSGNAPKFGR